MCYVYHSITIHKEIDHVTMVLEDESIAMMRKVFSITMIAAIHYVQQLKTNLLL